MMDMRAYDVAIVGGGPAGCATALALRRCGVPRVLLVEAEEYRGDRVGESVPPDTRLVLEELGVFDAFAADGHAPCLGSCSSWGSDDLGYNDFIFNAHGMGWHLDRRRFDASLADQAREANVEVRTRARFTQIYRAKPGDWTLSILTASGKRSTVRATFVVDASGSRSRLSRALGANAKTLDRLSCAAAYVEFERHDDFHQLSMLEGVELGWWYAAALQPPRAIVMVATDADILSRLRLFEVDGWREQLSRAKHLVTKLGKFRIASPSLHVRVAPSTMLDVPAGVDWAAVGDAASAYDPISARGIHQALFTGLHGGRAIAAALDGEPRGLARYRELVSACFADFVQTRAHIYGLERRWSDEAFWSRRRHAGYAGMVSRDPSPPRGRQPAEAELTELRSS